MDLENCWFVQFYTDKHDNVRPLRVKPLQYMGSERPFYGCVGGTRFGVHLHKDATHWGIFKVNPDEDDAELLTYDVLPENSKGKRNTLYRYENYYLFIRRSDRYIKFYASEYIEPVSSKSQNKEQQ